MSKTTVVIPNYNGIKYIERCLESLRELREKVPVIIVDNGSTDGSLELIQKQYPEMTVIALPENLGFPAAVNLGIRACHTEYVILLNNDTEVEPEFVRELEAGIEKSNRIFSCSAKLIKYHDREYLDDAGNLYCALGWAFAIGKDKPEENYNRSRKIFSSCAGAAIYRRALFEEIGYFDERHFAYLEDIDVGYRARIYGYENLFVPEARVYHIGSATSGSRYNEWKVKLSARNSIYLIYKNMPLPQIILNSPFLLLGILVKHLFFVRKKMGTAYIRGIREGFSMCRRQDKVHWKGKNFKNYCRIQLELWGNILRIVA